MSRTLALFLAAVSSPMITAAKPPLQEAARGPRIEPLAIAKVKRVNGAIVLDGDWLPYFDTRIISLDLPVFDSYGRHTLPGLNLPGTLGAFGPMSCIGPSGNTTDNGTRWSYGPAYNNPNTIEDLHDVDWSPSGVISEFDFGFSWNPPIPSSCIIVVFPYEEPLGASLGLCTDPVTFTDTGGGGFALNFGTLAPNAPSVYYYVTVSGLSNLGCLLPATDDSGQTLPDGSYQLIIADSLTTGGIIIAPGPSQPMLWGTGDANGETPRRGSNNQTAYDDDNPIDGVFDNPGECYDYSVGSCPDPLGKMSAFCTEGMPCPGAAGQPFTWKAWIVTGTSSGVLWSWAIYKTGINGFAIGDDNAGPVAANAGPPVLAAALVNSINATATASPCGATSLSAFTFTGFGQTFLLVGANSAFPWDLAVGPQGGPTPKLCTVTCTFNPTLEAYPLSGLDCNHDGVDDTVNVASGQSQDLNQNWIPDECETFCPADFNHDGFVDGIDSDQFNNAFDIGDMSADYNGDGFVDGIDYDQFNNDFEAGC